MSQWGAYGWAVDQGKDWSWILDHYYGGTAMGDADTTGTIDVQLKALDGATTVGVVSYVGAGNVNWGGKVAASMYATEVGPNLFQVYSAPTVACPAATTLTVPDGPIGRHPSTRPASPRSRSSSTPSRLPATSVDGLFGNQTGYALPHGRPLRASPPTGSGIPTTPQRRWRTDRRRSAHRNVDGDRSPGYPVRSNSPPTTARSTVPA